ncbi:MAG: PAS domain S-box protein, partial [Cohaesibacteraceae bacterium]|nr:PAS domain S-box protein [Cohaesibacteraceae bacterium]
LDKRDTWTGLKVFWPVDGEDLLVPVELTGLPIIRHQSGFEGYRGFGICFTGSAVKSERFEREQVLDPDADSSEEIEQPVISGVAATHNEVVSKDALQPDQDASEIAEQISSLDAIADGPENSEQSIEPTELSVNSEIEPALEPALLDDSASTADEVNADVKTVTSSSVLNELDSEPHDADENTLQTPEETERVVEDAENSDAGVIVSPITDEILEAARTAVTAVRELVAQGTGKPEKDGEPSLSGADELLASDDENTSLETLDADLVAINPDQAKSTGSGQLVPRLVSDQNAMDGSSPQSIESKTNDAANNDEVDIATDINDNSDEDQSDAKHKSKNIVVLDIPDTKAENSNVVILPKTPGAAAHTIVSLSTGEKAAFRQIAEALGANADGTKSKKTDLASTGAKNTTTNGNSIKSKSTISKTSNDQASEPQKTEDNQKPDSTVDQPDLDDVSVLSVFLDRIVTPLIVIQEDTIRFANRSSLELLGYNSSEEFEAVGGFETLFPDQEPGSGPKNILDANGISVSVTANVTTVMWENESAILLSMAPVAEPASSSAVSPGNETEISADVERIAELEAILDTATDGVIVLDSKGLVERMNHSAEALFEVERHDFAGQSFLDLFAEESHRSSVDYLESLTNNGVASVLNDGREVIGKTSASGGLIPLFITMGRLVQPGKTRFCMIVRDITQWKKAEEDLLTSKRKAEAASSQKSDFLARISHEIRTPLNAIIGFSEVMMEERFGSVGNERYKGYLSDIHLSGRHIMSLINDLLDLSKVEAGKLDLNFQAQNLSELIQDTVALMQPQANSEQIIIRTSLSDHVPSIVADERSLRQIVMNLLSNGIKYTRSGGQVIISTSYEDNGEVALRVRDTGVGMSEKQLEAALEPFRQLTTSSSTRMADGTGLGLPLTKALTEANRARFVISSKADKGTLVEITFPNARVLANQDH